MGNYDRDRGSRSGGGRGFNDRGSRGPVEMHRAVCDNCGKSCEVPFRPTSGKPIYCSSCFEHKGADSRPGRYEEKSMFDATCDECGNKCQVPFQPSSGKPIYCSNCFGEKKDSRSKNHEPSQPQYNNQFEELNSKLDKILAILTPKNMEKAVVEEMIKESPVEVEKKVKVTKKKPLPLVI